MTDIIVIDKRLAMDLVNYGPSYRHTIRVDESTLMLDMLQQVKGLVDYPNNKITSLIIAAHGYAEKGSDGKLYDGFGMQLCKEDLDLESVHFFRALDGFFPSSNKVGITLMGCGVAADSIVKRKDQPQLLGFGSRLCKALAQAASTSVMASTAIQDIEIGKVVSRQGGQFTTQTVFDPGRWEGDVWLFKTDGTREKVTDAQLLSGKPG